MKFYRSIRLMGVIMTLSLMGFMATPASARSSSSSGSSSHSTSSPSKSSPAPAKPSTGRSTTPPSNTGGSGSSTKPAAPTGRSTTPPSNTGGSGSSSSGTPKTTTTPKPVNPASKGTSSATPGKASTTATNPTTHVIYVYHTPSYYNTPYYHSYLGYYPPFGTADYLNLIGDPLYYPNYITSGNAFYGHAWPAGYVVRNNQFVPISHGTNWGSILMWIFVLLLIGTAIAVAVWYFVYRETPDPDATPGSYANKF